MKVKALKEIRGMKKHKPVVVDPGTVFEWEATFDFGEIDPAKKLDQIIEAGYAEKVTAKVEAPKVEKEPETVKKPKGK